MKIKVYIPVESDNDSTSMYSRAVEVEIDDEQIKVIAQEVAVQLRVHPTDGGHACPDCVFPNGKNVTHACVPAPTTSG